MSDPIKEYLVALKFDADDPSLAKFKSYMDLGEQTVTRHAGGMAKTMLESQFAIVGAFTGISAAAIGMMDKVAMADQGYRLMGLHMMMTTESARKMDIITKALGADLPTILFDQELHSRALQMSADIDRMSTALGPDFEKNMIGVRDLRFEFSRLEVATKFLGMQMVGDLFKKLGLGDVGSKLREWVVWFENHIPELSDKFTTFLVPVLKDTWAIMKGLGGVVEAGALAFTNLIGLLSGDSSIEDSEFNWEKFAKAVEHVEHALRMVIDAMIDAEKIVAHGSAAIAALLSGNADKAGKEFDKAGNSVHPGSSSILGALGVGGLLTALGIGKAGVGVAHLLGMGTAAAAGGTAAAAGGTAAAGAGAAGTALASSLIPAVGDTVLAVGEGGVITSLASGGITWTLVPAGAGGLITGTGAATTGAAAAGGAGVLSTVIAPAIAALAGVWTGRKLAISASESFEASERGKDWKAWKKEHEPDWLRGGARGLSDFFGLQSPAETPAPAAQPRPVENSHQYSGNYASDAEIGKALGTRVASEIQEAAGKYKIPESLALAVAYHESRFKNGAVNPNSGATGVMQLMPDTAKWLGVDAHNELQNIDGGVRFLAMMLDRYHGDQAKALAAYDWGPGRVKVDQPLPAPEHLPEETRKYLPEALLMQRQFEAAQAAANPSASLDMDRYRYPETPVPQSSIRETHVTVDVGGVHVAHTDANPEDIGREVAQQVSDRFSNDSRMNQFQFAPAWG
jgi:hypothetical protein